MSVDTAPPTPPIWSVDDRSEPAGPLAELGHPLRVLMVMHLPALLELGGARVQLELAEVLRENGCQVRVLDRAEILGGRRKGRLGVSPDAFAAAARRRVRDLASDFDIIDAHQGSLPVAKHRLGFSGLMVTRSVGLAPFYADFERHARERWPALKKGYLVTRPLHRRRNRRFLEQVEASFRLSDLIIVPNRDELLYMRDHLGAQEKTVVRPLGISESQLSRLHPLVNDRAGAGPRVAFIGAWCARKGSEDWREIAARVRRSLPEASFTFLGTHSS